MLTQIYFDNNGPTAVSQTNPIPVQIYGGGGDSDFSSNLVTNVANVSPVLVQQGEADKNIKITDIVVSASAAMRIDLQDSDGDVVFTAFVGANGSVSKIYLTPLEVETAKNLMVKTSAAGNVAVNVSGNII